MAESTGQERWPWVELADAVSEESKADVWFYSGPIERGQLGPLDEWCRSNQKQKNVFFILSTYGGDPHTAYRIGRSLQKHYESVALCINGPCVSAGTLLALAAHEIVMADAGTLGPLDIQVAKEDDQFESTSGLTTRQAIATLTSHASSTFDQFLMALKVESGGPIALQTAMESAAQLTAKMYEPLFGQIDPLQLADDQRSLAILSEYGERLAEGSRNLRPGALEKLLYGYSSHQFVIDREEAAERLFLRVRNPSGAAEELLGVLWKLRTEPSRTPLLRCLTDRGRPTKEDPHEPTHHRTDPARSIPQGHKTTEDRARTDEEGKTSPRTDPDSGQGETIH